MAKFLDGAGLERLWEKFKAYVDSHASGGGGIPSGCILIWSGAADAVPDGWALCDGNNGTPDLRGRFVLGHSTGHAVGTTGGAETVTLTEEQMPEHNHAQTTGYYIGNGFYAYGILIKGSTQYATSRSGGISYSIGDKKVYGEVVNASETKPSVMSYGTATSRHYTMNTYDSGGGSAHNNMPPYYALCYIMKL